MTLSSAIQHAILSEFGGKRGAECLNTRLPLPTLLCAGYSVKLIYFIYLVYTYFFLFKAIPPPLCGEFEEPIICDDSDIQCNSDDNCKCIDQYVRNSNGICVPVVQSELLFLFEY